MIQLSINVVTIWRGYIWISYHFGAWNNTRKFYLNQSELYFMRLQILCFFLKKSIWEEEVCLFSEHSKDEKKTQQAPSDPEI